MENYILKENETVLYRGNATIMPDGKGGKNAKQCDVWLTNLNIVLMVQKKKLLKTLTEVETYSVADVKKYNDSVQVIRRKSVVDIYLNTGEIFLGFGKEKEAKLFTDKALRLISGENKVVRSVKKVRKEVSETNEALDIDIVDKAKKGVKLTTGFAAEAAIEVAKIEGVGKKAKILGAIGSVYKRFGTQQALSEATIENELPEATVENELPAPSQDDN